MPAHVPPVVLRWLPRPAALASHLLVCLLAGGLGIISGCATVAVAPEMVRGAPPDLPSTAGPPASAGGPADGGSSFASLAPAPAKDVERPVQWAEARVPATLPPASTGTTPVAWQTAAKGSAGAPALVEQGTTVFSQQGPPIVYTQPEQTPAFAHAAPPLDLPQHLPEQAPPPRVIDNYHPTPAPGVTLGPPVPHAPNEMRKMSLPTYTVAPPDILLIESTQGLPNQNIKGQHLVRPDGTINLGLYGSSVYVAGLTLDQIRALVADAIQSRLDEKEVKVKVENVTVDVLAYNSKVYYIITDGGGFGAQVYRVPVTGNETVLDAIAQINGLPAVSSKKIWVARRTLDGHNNILPVDWCAITQRGNVATNYQLFPGDRLYVQADRLIATDNWLAKFLAPIERVLGVTLLGSSTVNSIRNSNGNNNNNNP
jgi:polysaccharide export outer membrane protein